MAAGPDSEGRPYSHLTDRATSALTQPDVPRIYITPFSGPRSFIVYPSPETVRRSRCRAAKSGIMINTFSCLARPDTTWYLVRPRRRKSARARLISNHARPYTLGQYGGALMTTWETNEDKDEFPLKRFRVQGSRVSKVSRFQRVLPPTGSELRLSNLLPIFFLFRLPNVVLFPQCCFFLLFLAACTSLNRGYTIILKPRNGGARPTAAPQAQTRMIWHGCCLTRASRVQQ